ncbi:ABC transporter permease [Candidatus Shapirobacteria bacterium]|nr:ABC transporter permease [Candidatus Shapirobacteria bacterium]
MKFLEIVTESIGTLGLNKMRTGLAALGIIIGIGSVIALISLGTGSQKSIENQIQSLGANLLTVQPGGQRNGNVRTAAGSNTTLTLEDSKSISTSPKVTSVKNVSPELSRRSQIIAGKNNTNTQVLGVYPQYSTVRKVSLSAGVFISENDVSSLSKVAVLGPQVVTDLFGEDFDPIGQSIRIGSQSFKVIGVTTSKGGSGFNNQDDIVYVPLSTAQKQLYGVDYLSSISLEANSADVMVDAQNEVGYLLLERHKLSDPTKADFMIMSQSDILNTASQVTTTFTTLLGGIAAISLLVGGIGIMNIMLVTVTERTREIGLRQALGAKKKTIITQFLVESVILTFFGGILGMVFGILTSYGLSSLMNIPFAISIPSIVLAIGVSGAIGIIFGWYPARRAASLQPIEALRYE